MKKTRSYKRIVFATSLVKKRYQYKLKNVTMILIVIVTPRKTAKQEGNEVQSLRFNAQSIPKTYPQCQFLANQKETAASDAYKTRESKVNLTRVTKDALTSMTIPLCSLSMNSRIRTMRIVVGNFSCLFASKFVIGLWASLI